MAKAKKVHPTDARDAAIVAGAVSFNVNLFLGAGRYDRVQAQTLEAARIAAAELEYAHQHTRRTALIYAVDASGASALVTPTILAIVAATGGK
ncbi:MAG: hypothetical protein NW206_20010 [Hyphomonadaceae bacterium]|nr:hypothetical protein [Hyphomonadaceae bacterium]